MLDKFIIIGATTLTLSGIVGAILIISWPKKPQPIKEMHLKEADIFMDEFLDSFYLSLDEMK